MPTETPSYLRNVRAAIVYYHPVVLPKPYAVHYQHGRDAADQAAMAYSYGPGIAGRQCLLILGPYPWLEV